MSRIRWTVAAVGVLLVALAAGLLWVRYDSEVVRTAVMRPAIVAGSTVLVDTNSADAAGIRRGDVVLVSAIEAWPDDEAVRDWPGDASELTYALRVVGLPGDTVTCCGGGGGLTVNGELVPEAYAETAGNAAYGEFSAEVPEGRLFLLADARDIARDSRVHLDRAGGTVPVAAVLGRVEAAYWPPWQARLLGGDEALRAVEPARPTGGVPLFLVALGALLVGLCLALWGFRTPVRRGFSRLAVAGHDVGDVGWESGGWGLVSGGSVGSMVVVVDVPDE